MKPTIVFHGNCQSLAFYAMAIKDLELVEQYTIALLRVSDDPEPDRQFEILSNEPATARELLSNCAYFFQQKSFWENTCDYADRLPSRCRKVSFPMLSLELLWPFFMYRPYPRPFGREDNRRGHGDRNLHNLIKKKLPPLETLARFMTTDIKKLLDLDRSRDLFFDKLRALDKEVDIPVAGLIEDLFCSRQLFLDATHPTAPLFYYVAARLFHHVGLMEKNIDHNWEGHFSFTPTFPIHPQVIDHYGLQWVNHGTRYGFHVPKPYMNSVYVEKYQTWDGDYGYLAGLRRHLEMPDATLCLGEGGSERIHSLHGEVAFWDALPKGPMAKTIAAWQAELLTVLGDYHLRAGELDQARALYQRAMEQNTAIHSLLPSLLKFLDREDRFDEALTLLIGFINGPNFYYCSHDEKLFLADSCVKFCEALAKQCSAVNDPNRSMFLQRSIPLVNACLKRIMEVAERQIVPPLENLAKRLGQSGDPVGQSVQGMIWSYEPFYGKDDQANNIKDSI
ncbi:MAG: hypothetical protein HQL65_08860 [Magnetococcales bacterium]|nr:hypothetical protein [Magnetococcales bacterium]